MRFTQEQLEELTNTFSDIEIGQQFGCRHGTVRYYRVKYGIKSYTEKTNNCKSTSEGKVRRRGTTDFSDENPDNLIVDYFQNIDTPDKAYWIGLLAADGCITDDWRVQIGLNIEDRYIIELLASCLGVAELVRERVVNHEGLLGKSKSTHSCQLRVSSKQMCLDLERQGLVPRKTRVIQISPCAFDYPTHYLRGYLDGNGSICEKNFAFTSGSEKLIDQIRELIYENIGVWLNKRTQTSKDTGGICHTLWGYKQDSSVLQWIYNDIHLTSCFLERKRMKFSRFWC